MIILTIRTDKPEAEIGLFDGDKKLAYETWQAHRELAETIHKKIKTMLASADKEWPDIAGVLTFKGPGSFTGLRIGLTVANALSASLNIRVVARGGEDWLETGLKDLQNGQNDELALPDYGAPPHVTAPK